MKLARRLVLTTSLIASLASVAPIAFAGSDPTSHGVVADDQVHRPRDVFTDGGHIGARDPYLDGAHGADQR